MDMHFLEWCYDVTIFESGMCNAFLYVFKLAFESVAGILQKAHLRSV